MSDIIAEGVERARSKGIDDIKILDSISQGDQGELYRDGIAKAREKGIEPAKIVDSIVQGRANLKEDARANQTWGEWAGDIGKGLIHGVGAQIGNVGSTLQAPADAPQAEQTGLANQASEKLMGAGQAIQNMTPGYEPGGATWNPSTWPKAIAEAAPAIAGYLAAARAGAAVGSTAGMLGGPFAEVTVPVGAVVGGLGGMGVYAYGQNRGVNATAHANERGLNFPEKQDFDRTLAPTIAQSALDAGATAAGGLVGKVAGNALGAGADKIIRGAVGDGVTGKIAGTVLNGPNPITGTGVKGLVNTGARVLTTDAALAAQGAGDSAIHDFAATRDNEGGPSISFDKALQAAKEGAILGTALRGARSAGSLHAAAKFRGGDAEALDRVANHMKSDDFPVDVADPKKAELALSMAKDLYKKRVKEAAAPAEGETGLTGRQQDAVDSTMSLLKRGGTLEGKQLASLKDTLSDAPKVVEEIRNLNAVNFMADRSGITPEPKASLGSVLKAAKHPFALGGLGSVGLEAAIHGAGGLGLATLGTAGGVGAAAYLGAKTLGHLTGIAENNNRPLSRMMDRFGDRQGAPMGPVGSLSDPMTAAQQVIATQRAREALATAQAAQGAPRAPEPSQAPQGAPMPHPEAPPIPAAEPVAAEPHPALAEAMGGMAAPMVMQSSGPRRSAPAPAVEAAPIGDIHAEIAAQAKAEGQPLLDVYGQHLRSAFSVAKNDRIPEPVRARAAADAVELKTAMDKLGETASPEAMKRARSPLAQEEPAPGYEPVFSDLRGFTREGAAYARSAGPSYRAAMSQAAAPAQAEAATAKFLSGFPTKPDAELASKKLAQNGLFGAITAKSKAGALNMAHKHGKTGRPRGRPKKK
ncbi:hypothetical protein ACFZ8E_07495 [Methylobacterium sp. HMF5984]|uniref:hypothetical protein n=1 Tax=Methylobacterium sp. HMF5984 TaxID=3367370 RepID=UPI003853F94F